MICFGQFNVKFPFDTDLSSINLILISCSFQLSMKNNNPVA